MRNGCGLLTKVSEEITQKADEDGRRRGGLRSQIHSSNRKRTAKGILEAFGPASSIKKHSVGCNYTKIQLSWIHFPMRAKLYELSFSTEKTLFSLFNI